MHVKNGSKDLKRYPQTQAGPPRPVPCALWSTRSAAAPASRAEPWKACQPHSRPRPHTRSLSSCSTEVSPLKHIPKPNPQSSPNQRDAMQVDKTGVAISLVPCPPHAHTRLALRACLCRQVQLRPCGTSWRLFGPPGTAARFTSSLRSLRALPPRTRRRTLR